MKRILCPLVWLFFSLGLAGQHTYIPPRDSLVAKKLSEWQDLKFGLLMHWGTYSQWGIVESWSICPEDEGWTKRNGPYSKDYYEYVKAYEGLQKTFAPKSFDPGKWAQAAKDAGMKYVVFTTKHHDGFCMFDSKFTDYKITGNISPFRQDPRANITKEIFSAFRKEGLWTGAYFSKPDWHSPYYWWPYFPPKDRNVNYDPEKYPDRWNAFKEFTYDQIKELVSEYGKLDILWLDGGWVRPLSSIDTSIEWQKGIKFNQDIDMKKIAEMARSFQPGLIIVDRSVTGEYENYTTPEQEVPATPLPYPWETCLTMAGSWSYVPGDKYKSAHVLIELLIRIVAKGGNLLLNIGPSPTGEWDTAAYGRLQDIGAWLKINGEAIYSSRPLAPYSYNNVCYTQSKDHKVRYAIYLSPTEELANTGKFDLGPVSVPPGASITILGIPVKVKSEIKGTNLVVSVPPTIKKFRSQHAIVFRISEKEQKPGIK